MKIGIFGGAFNPPHTGHVNAAVTAAGKNNLDLLIVIPTGTSPHKNMPGGTPPPDMRLQMTKNAFKDTIPEIDVSDMEMYSNNKNYTIDTIILIKDKYPGAELFLLVGNDMYDTLDTWKDSGALLNLVTPVLLPRNVINISSTEIREMLAKRDGRQYLTGDNYSLIIKHRFYNALPAWDWLRESVYARLDGQRIKHTEGCESTALQLALHWGENPDDAREAAILHDMTKKLDFNENMCIIAESGLVTNNYNIDEAKLLHSITAAILAKSEYGVSDRVAEAIRLHTTADAGMTLLDKILYLADYIEPARDFPGVSELRRKAFEDIDKAMLMGLHMAADDLISRGISVNNATYRAIYDLENKSIPERFL